MYNHKNASFDILWRRDFCLVVISPLIHMLSKYHFFKYAKHYAHNCIGLDWDYYELSIGEFYIDDV